VEFWISEFKLGDAIKVRESAYKFLDWLEQVAILVALLLSYALIPYYAHASLWYASISRSVLPYAKLFLCFLIISLF